MKIHWLIPITIDCALQFTSKSELARAVRRAGHSMTTLVAYVAEQTPMDSFSAVEYCHTPPGGRLSRLRFHWKMLRSTWQASADVVIFGFQAGHLLPFAWLGRWFVRSRPVFVMDIRTVPVDVKGDLRGRIELLRYRLSLLLARLFCDGITVITPMLGASIRPHVGCLGENIGIWTSGVDLDRFPRSGPDCRRDYKLCGKRVVIYHGVLSPNRGLQNALRAFSAIATEMPELAFFIVGDGSGRGELEDLARSLGIADRTIFTGKVPYAEIPRYVRSAELAILPFPDISWWQVSSPIKLMEYLALGIPIVATDIAAHRWVLDRTGGAVLADNDAPGALETAMRKCLLDAPRAADLELLEELVSWNRQAASLLEYLRRLRPKRGHELP